MYAPPGTPAAEAAAEVAADAAAADQQLPTVRLLPTWTAGDRAALLGPPLQLQPKPDLRRPAERAQPSVFEPAEWLERAGLLGPRLVASLKEADARRPAAAEEAAAAATEFDADVPAHQAAATAALRREELVRVADRLGDVAGARGRRGSESATAHLSLPFASCPRR